MVQILTDTFLSLILVVLNIVLGAIAIGFILGIIEVAKDTFKGEIDE